MEEMMEFVINNEDWKIKLVDKDTLKKDMMKKMAQIQLLFLDLLYIQNKKFG